jgi:RNA polymerase sigma-70 factor (ECF subfamily)
MRTRWKELHAGLLRSIDRREVRASFAALQGRAPLLAPFSGPAAVVAFLVDKQSGLVARDRVLRCLVEEAKGGGARRIALALLLLGLWPAMSSIVGKRSYLFQREAHDIEMEIVDRLIAQVQRIDLGRVSCLAATLVRSTERELVTARVRERVRAAKQQEVTADALSAPALDEELPVASPFGLAVNQSDGEHVAGLRRWLQSAVGRDADLVLDAVVHQRRRADLAASLGISHAAARKRLERALVRAREALLDQTRSRSADAAAWVL